MTVPDQTPQNVHTANGATTTFAYQFKILDTDHLEVYLDDVLQTSGYTVTGEGVNAGGTVVFTTAPANGTEVILMRSMTIERTAYDYQNAGDFLAATVNEDFDAAIMIAQQINNTLTQRALLFPKTLDRTNNTNALPEPEEGRVLYWASGEIQNALISSLATNPTFASELRTFDTMAQAIADATLEETNVLLVAGRGNSTWDLSASGTANGWDVVYLTASGLYATLRTDGVTIRLSELGAALDGVTPDTDIANHACENWDVVINDGVCLIDDTVYYKSGNWIINASQNCGILLESGVSANMFYPAGTFGTEASPNNHYIDGFSILGGYIDQNITDAGDFVESIMSVVALSVKRLRIETEFRNPSGDCVYINKMYGGVASTVIPDDIIISKCAFRGTNINRNGVSVICANNFKINHNNFYNITKVGMPAPIDLEPNTTADTITNGQIIGNNFYGCRGGIATYTTGTTEYDHIRNIVITGNNAYDSYHTGAYTTRCTADFAIFNASNITFSNNNSTDGVSVGIWLENCKNVTGSNNNVINIGEVGVFFKDIYECDLHGRVEMENDTYEGLPCYGILSDTDGLISANNHSFEGGCIDFEVYNNTGSKSQSIGVYLRGNVTNVKLKGFADGWRYGLYLERRSDVYPNKIENTMKFGANNTTNIGSNIGASTSDQQSWDCGKDVSWGKSSFSASTTKDITGLHVFSTSIVSVTRLGTTGLANTLSASCSVAGTLRITSNASESGEFVWRILSP